MRRTRSFLLAAVVITTATAAMASWYDDYDAGIVAAQKGQWAGVVQQMTAAIKGNPKENDKTHTYGTIFINYHPYYYRAVANLNLGKYQQAIDDLDKATGAGEKDFGSIDALHQRAQTKLDAASAPVETPNPTPTPVQPRPVTPVPVPPPTNTIPSAPSVDPGLRQRADSSLTQARARIQAAQGRRATTSPQYAEAMKQFTDANLRRASAKTNDDFSQVAAAADNAVLLADSAVAPGVAAPPPPKIAVITPKTDQAAGAVLGDTQKKLHHALELYFAGEFAAAATDFSSILKNNEPNNGLLWAFLGASQYAQYAFEQDPQFKEAAAESFRKARRLRPSLQKGLPDRYFSRRIRRFFNEVS